MTKDEKIAKAKEIIISQLENIAENAELELDNFDDNLDLPGTDDGEDVEEHIFDYCMKLVKHLGEIK